MAIQIGQDGAYRFVPRPPGVVAPAYPRTSVQSRFDVSIIIPTKNEARNIEPLFGRLRQALAGYRAQVIFVDDSTDNTSQVIERLPNGLDLHVTMIARPPERRANGLGGAVVEGFRAAQSSWACVMDADLQHPPEIIGSLIDRALQTGAHVVVGSRLARGGDASSLGWRRSLTSRIFATSTRAAFPARLRSVTDPLSGLFLVKLNALDLDALQPDGFKILLDIMVRCPDLQVTEVPILFGYRYAGESKASLLEVWRFFRLLLRLRLGAHMPFARFLAVGASGLVVNSLAIMALTELLHIHYLVSAALATQTSTLWNFLLTEIWVFRGRRIERALLRRLAGFWVMNNLALVLRGPIVALMVSALGLHYAVANVISLLSMTLLRYFAADQWLWMQSLAGSNLAPKPGSEAAMHASTSPTTAGAQEAFSYAYDIHGIIRVLSMFRLPELDYFRVFQPIPNPDIRVRRERRSWKERRRAARESGPRRSSSFIHYDEWLGRNGFEIRIAQQDCVEVAVSRIVALSPHVLYTNVVEPILRWAFVRRGYALVHAASVAFDGHAILITARTDTGKTSTILRAVKLLACSFISDDMTILGRDGQVLSYPKPLTISKHTLQAIESDNRLTFSQRMALQVQSRLHSRSGRNMGLRLSRTKLPAATMNAVVQMLIPPPKYMVDSLVPTAKFADHAVLSGAVVIERGQEHESKLTHEEAVSTFVSNAEDAYGFPPYPVLATSLSTHDGKDLHDREKSIIAEALLDISTVRLRDPNYNWWQHLQAIAQLPPRSILEPRLGPLPLGSMGA